MHVSIGTCMIDRWWNREIGGIGQSITWSGLLGRRCWWHSCTRSWTSLRQCILDGSSRSTVTSSAPSARPLHRPSSISSEFPHPPPDTTRSPAMVARSRSSHIWLQRRRDTSDLPWRRRSAHRVEAFEEAKHPARGGLQRATSHCTSSRRKFREQWAGPYGSQPAAEPQPDCSSRGSRSSTLPLTRRNAGGSYPRLANHGEPRSRLLTTASSSSRAPDQWWTSPPRLTAERLVVVAGGLPPSRPASPVGWRRSWTPTAARPVR